jgi:hypothetical protein
MSFPGISVVRNDRSWAAVFTVSILAVSIQSHFPEGLFCISEAVDGGRYAAIDSHLQKNLRQFRFREPIVDCAAHVGLQFVRAVEGG